MNRREFLANVAAASFFYFASGESKTMEQRISLVTLGVRDLGTSKRFYSGGLGWTPVFENKEIIFFQTGGMVFALFLRDKLAEDFQVDPATFGRAAVALAYNVSAKNEVDPLINKAVAAGATILKPAREASWEATRATLRIPMGLPGKWPGIQDGDWRRTAA